MNYLYLLTEDDNDDLFYEGCVEKLTGKSYSVLNRRIRKGSGISAVRSSLRLLLQDIRRTGHLENTFFLVAIDNDRAPVHPKHPQIEGLSRSDRSKQCRVCELQEVLNVELDTDRSEWPIRGAIAIPVEMLESWLLLICGHRSDTLPFFGRKAQTIAKKYYSPKSPPDQLKDLCNQEIQNSSVGSMAEFCLTCATDLLDPDDLATKSPSFAHFKTQIETWI
ncbi:MAG: hypothetical protein AAF702_28065 [Chloroflexota bacterium]